MNDANNAGALLPCPFCGSEAEIERLGDHHRSTIYQCTSCGCSLETGEEWGHGKQWNERAALPTPNALDEAAIRKDEREKCAAIATSRADKWESSACNANGDVDFNFISKSARHFIADALNGIAYEFASAIRNGGKQP